MGSCYESEKQFAEAIKCFEFAERTNEHETTATTKLAQLHRPMKDFDTAAFYYKRVLDRCDENQVEDEDMIESLSFLATYTLSKEQIDEVEDDELFNTCVGMRRSPPSVQYLFSVRHRSPHR